MKIAPFRALRPPVERTAKLASPPYDVMSAQQARKRAEANPASFVHVIRPEVDLSEADAQDKPKLYNKACQTLDGFLAQGFLQKDEKPNMYIYRLHQSGHIQTGVVCVSSVRDYVEGRIKKHEFTRAAPEEDRTSHIQTLGAQTGPVFLTFRDEEPVQKAMDEVTSGTPSVDFTADDKVRHTIWQVPSTDRFVALFDAVPCTYIADGHHRAAAAARVAADPGRCDPEEAAWFLTVLFPASHLNILAYNRLVHDISPLTQDDFLKKLESVCRVSRSEEKKPSQAGRVSIYINGEWMTASWEDLDFNDPVTSLDVWVLQERILKDILGIEDPRKDPRLSFVGGHDSVEVMEQAVQQGEARMAISMYPTQIDQLMAVSDADDVMPPKSTWFEPKLRSGLFVHDLMHRGE